MKASEQQTVAAGLTKFISLPDFTINQGDAHIGTYNRTANLDTGQFYTDSLMVEIPVSASGNMILILKPISTTLFLKIIRKITTLPQPLS